MKSKQENQLDILEQSGLFNFPVSQYENREFMARGRRYFDFCSTSYLSYEYDPRVHQGAIKCGEKWGALTNWSRMEADCQIYLDLEKRICNLVGASNVLLGLTITSTGFSSLPTIAKKGVIFADHVLHAVVWEACRLARDHGATLLKFRHQDLNHLEELLKANQHISPKVIVVDGVYSISTELAPILEMQALCRKYDAWLYVDDAHGFGILGREPSSENTYGVGGSGIVNHLGGDYERTFYVTGFGKAFCSQVAFCTIPEAFKESLKATSTQYLYSPPPSPYLIGATDAILTIDQEIGESQRKKMRDLVTYFLDRLKPLKIIALNNLKHPVVYVEVGELPQLIEVATHLDRGGILAGLRAYPVVPADRCGLRFAITAMNTEKHIDRVIELLSEKSILAKMRRSE